MFTLEVPAFPSTEDLRALTQKLKMLADPTRLAILITLTKGDANVSDICEALKLSQPTASHHLGLLRMTGFVTSQRDGKSVIYSVVGGTIKGRTAVIQLLNESSEAVAEEYCW